MNFIKHICLGIAIGSGAILPGISSGVLCVIFGVYDKLIHSVLNFFTDIKKNFSFLFPILLGISIGVILFGNILKILFQYCRVPTCFCFIGLILGCTPLLLKKANVNKGFRLHYILFFLLTFVITIISLIIENNFVSTITVSNPTFFYLVLCGFLMSVGVVVPGVSSTVILMLLNVYDIYLTSIATLQFSVLLPIGIGLILGGFIFLKIIDYLLKNHFSETYYAIIGFTVSSIFVLYPGFECNLQGFVSLLLLFICFKIGYLLEK